jgi:hypothetical protein
MAEKFIENDLDAASRIFENLPEEDAANAFQSLQPALAVRMIKHLQISFAADLLKDTEKQNYQPDF